MDSRDLIERRDFLKDEIFKDFLEAFEHYAEMTESFEDILFEEEEIQEWREDWEHELSEIEDINQLEDEVVSDDNFDDGVTFIEEDEFEDYCKEFTKDVGFIPDHTPALIENNIDWEGIADDMRQDYAEVEFEGRTYLYR